jgi:hypothetical protein
VAGAVVKLFRNAVVGVGAFVVMLVAGVEYVLVCPREFVAFSCRLYTVSGKRLDRENAVATVEEVAVIAGDVTSVVLYTPPYL